MAEAGCVTLPDAAATAALGERLAAALGPGDAVLLSGPLGAGKSTLARAAIAQRYAALGLDAPALPSPTYTLAHLYEVGGVEIWHADLYRLTDAAEVEDLGLLDAFETAILFIEWPERLGAYAPARRLALDVDLEPGGGRRLVWRATGGGWAAAAAALGSEAEGAA